MSSPDVNSTLPLLPPLLPPTIDANPADASPPEPAVPGPSHRSDEGLSRGTVVGLVVGTGFGALIVLIAMGICFFFYRRKKKREAQALTGACHSWNQYAAPPGMWSKSSPLPPSGPAVKPQQANVHSSVGPSTNSWLSSDAANQSPYPGVPVAMSQNMFAYEVLAKATDNFSETNLIGQGGFGYVHKGILPDETVVAIKQLKSESKQGEREFQAEVQIISRVHHRHLVSLVGYCISGSWRMLVYEFMSNKTLDYHLHEKGGTVMDWPTRMKIGLGAAKGLTYLHEECHPKIIHRDIKATNILLDDDFEAKVSDFGLAKLSPDSDTHVSTRIMGTFGYLAPEYASSGKLTDKSDVFSYGIVLLELITGCRPVDKTRPFADDSIVDWARPLMTQALEDGNFEPLVDPKLRNVYDRSEMMRMVACAAVSVRHSSRRRPKMSQIVRTLEGSLSVEELNHGAAPGHSTVYSIDGGSDYDTAMYKEDLQKFRKMALESQVYASSEYSVITSEPNQTQSSSSTEGHQKMQEMEQNGVQRGLEEPGKPS